MKTKQEENHNTHMIRKILQKLQLSYFLIVAAHFCQKEFSKIFFQVSHNPLHLQNSMQSNLLFLHLNRLVHCDLHPHLTVCSDIDSSINYRIELTKLGAIYVIIFTVALFGAF